MIKKQSEEDYLGAIYYISEQNDGVVRSIDIVKYLNISRPSVSEMLKKMTKHKLIKMKVYSSITFTAKGLKKAKKIIYKQRVIEVFLKNILKIKKQNLNREAHKLEHAFSDEAIKKLAKFLNNPKVCPCGHKIPIL